MEKLCDTMENIQAFIICEKLFSNLQKYEQQKLQIDRVHKLSLIHFTKNYLNL